MNYKTFLIAIFAFGLISSSFVVECVTDESATAEELSTDETKVETVFETTEVEEEETSPREEITTGKEEESTEKIEETTEKEEESTEKIEETTAKEEESTEKIENTTEKEEESTEKIEETTEKEEESTEKVEETTEKAEEVSTDSGEETTEKEVEITTPTDEVEELNGKCECLAGISGTILIGSSLKEIHLNDEKLSVKCNSNAAESCKKLCLAKIKKGNKGLKLRRKTGTVMCALLKLTFKRKVEIWSKITCDSSKYAFAVTTTTNTGYSFKGKLSCKDGHLAIKSKEDNTDETDETNETNETDETDEDDD